MVSVEEEKAIGKIAKVLGQGSGHLDHDIIKAFEVLRSKYTQEELRLGLRTLRGIIGQLDGRTLGLIAYNNWNTRPWTCWCNKSPFMCPCTPYKEPEKWMSIAHDFHGLDMVVCVEVSDISGVGLALNGDLFYRDWGGMDCDTLPSKALDLIKDLEELNELQ